MLQGSNEVVCKNLNGKEVTIIRTDIQVPTQFVTFEFFLSFFLLLLHVNKSLLPKGFKSVEIRPMVSHTVRRVTQGCRPITKLKVGVLE